jgi:phage-related baseplate assembly protein
MAGLALAEVLASIGDEDGARRALRPVRDRLTAIASTIADPHRRARFWNRPLPNAKLVLLTAKLGEG